jgi:phosphoribosyl-AMP cyclohydrolase
MVTQSQVGVDLIRQPLMLEGIIGGKAMNGKEVSTDQFNLEEGTELRLDFGRFHSRDGTGVMPVAVQDVDTGELLLIGHVSQAAFEQSLKTKTATFWSMSRNELWIKGATSGNTLELIEVRVNCEQNSLLYRVRLQKGGACHTKDRHGKFRLGCYYRTIENGRLVARGSK